MWYFLSFLVLIWIIYKFSKKKESSSSSALVGMDDNVEQEEKEQSVGLNLHVRVVEDETEKQRQIALEAFKKSYKKPQSVEEALSNLRDGIQKFIENHGISLCEIMDSYQSIEIPKNLQKRELFLRKEISRFYKNRENALSKANAIYFSFKHAQLLIEHPQENWKNFLGLQKLQANLKAEEYFESLLGIMIKYKDVFQENDITKKLNKDIEKNFQLWNSLRNSFDYYENIASQFERAKSASEKHFIILPIVDYLYRRYRFNPQFKEELISWCKKDIDLYENFLIESWKFSFNDFTDKGVIVRKHTFEDVKKLKDYNPPRLNSFDVLWKIYEQDSKKEELAWLESIAKHIKYREFSNDFVGVQKK